jgi:hypothetical protein
MLGSDIGTLFPACSKVYLGAIVILISAMRHGPTPRRVRELSARFGADRRTIARWQVFWREHFPNTPFWKSARARLVPIVEILFIPSTKPPTPTAAALRSSPVVPTCRQKDGSAPPASCRPS